MITRSQRERETEANAVLGSFHTRQKVQDNRYAFAGPNITNRQIDQAIPILLSQRGQVTFFDTLLVRLFGLVHRLQF